MDLSTAKYIMDYLYFNRTEEPSFRYYKKSKLSIFRGIILCLCLNLTYANVVRFPRELDRHGIEFLIPYLLILFLIGLPIVLLEIALGQFLGQGSAHSWRASPIFRGASVVGRLASWLGSIWVSMQGAMAMVYIGELLLYSVPFSRCETAYVKIGRTGQECLSHTFLTPVWNGTLFFALLSMSLIVLWTLAAVCTYSGKTLRRSIIVIGLVALILLAFQMGWETTKIVTNKRESPFAKLWRKFDESLLGDSAIWFNALIQVLFSTNIGTGVLPVVTGKFLYKGDAVRTSLVYVSFNILILILSTSFFMTQFQNVYTQNSTIILPELKPFTSIYDNALTNTDTDQASLLAICTYAMIVLITISTVALHIYTASRLLRRHPNYVMSLTALVVSVSALICPNYMVARIFDTRIVGAFVICSLAFDIISIAWVYGAKNIYTDLEFSIGRPIAKVWVLLWCLSPVWVVSIAIWWLTSYNQADLGIVYAPRWIPIAISLAIIFLLASAEVYKQVDYNCCSMIREAGVSSKDWGPADPIVRHAWKQWTSVCEDTGQKDFTLRRRGTRDYTHSIKKGQYSRSTNTSYVNGATTHVLKTSTPGSNSPNYSGGSIFGDSAIEEDISVAKYPGYHTHLHRMHISGNDDEMNGGKPLRYSNGSRKTSESERSQHSNPQYDKYKHMYYIRPPPPPSALERNSQNISKIDITLNGDPSAYNTITIKNTAGRPPEALPTHMMTPHSHSNHHHHHVTDNYSSLKRGMATGNGTDILKNSGVAYLNGNGTDHICWRKYSANAEEYSTEL